MPGAGRPRQLPKSGAVAPDPPQRVREPLPHSLPRSQATGRRARGCQLRAQGQPGPPWASEAPPPAPPPQGGRRGSGGRFLTFPSAWRPKKTERERGRAGERREGGETHEARRESKREKSERARDTHRPRPSSSSSSSSSAARPNMAAAPLPPPPPPLPPPGDAAPAGPGA